MRSFKVLVVEDEIIAATFIKRVLRDFGYETCGHFTSGEEALVFIENNPVDIVLMDIVLEGELDGIDTAKIITQKFNTPVLYLTSYSDEMKIDRAITTEPFGYILKPINERELHANIRMSVFKHDLEKKLRTYVIDLENHQHKLEQQAKLLAASEKKLQQLNESKDKLFSIIAHDLRSPFNVLLGFSEYLAQDADRMEKEALKKLAGEMNASMKNVFSLLDNLLDWARIQTGRVELQPAFFNVTEQINITLKLLSPLILQKELHVDVSGITQTEIYADHSMFTSAMQNLLTNAIKFTHRGGKISIGSTADANFYHISVADNGIGISEEKKKQLLRLGSNSSTFGTENEPGSGLGLILVSEFAQKSGGALSFESEKGAGSKFIISLPIPDNTMNIVVGQN